MVYKMVANQTQSPSFCVWINYSQQLQFLVSYIGYIYIYINYSCLVSYSDLHVICIITLFKHRNYLSVAYSI